MLLDWTVLRAVGVHWGPLGKLRSGERINHLVRPASLGCTRGACLRLAGVAADAATVDVGAGVDDCAVEDAAGGAAAGLSYPATRRSRNGWQKYSAWRTELA